MAKDPAVLFYTADFITGTAFMSFEERGQYITLLCLQHQTGSISEEDMINICGTKDGRVFKKFKRNDDGTFYNSRMKEEADKRKAFCESRKKNRTNSLKPKPEKKKRVIDICETSVSHMENENENINEDKNKGIGGAGEKGADDILQTIEEHTEYEVERCLEVYRGTGYEMARNTLAHMWKITPEQVLMWAEIFAQDLMARSQPKKTMADFAQHFSNWLKMKSDKQNPKKYYDGQDQHNTKNGSGAYAGRATNATAVLQGGGGFRPLSGNGGGPGEDRADR